MAAYQVLARTWRPQRFSEIVGQGHITQTLTNIVDSGRIGHAYLFAGTRGVGKTSVARIFAKALNCKEPDGVEPCNQCTSCKEISQGFSIDVMEIDGASNNGVNSIRDLRKQVGYLPTSGKYKIYIIDEVHMLTESAFNALLKTLEEPPSHVLFIFATTEVHEIPATILSRCQRFNFRKISRKEISEHLVRVIEKESISISPNGINLIAKEANGSIRDGLSLLEQVVSFSGKEISDRKILDSIGLVDQGLINRTIKSLFAKDVQEILEVIRSINEYGYDYRTFLTSLVQQVRNILVVKIHLTNPTLNAISFKDFIDLPEEEIEELKSIAAMVESEKTIHRIYTLINDAIPGILSSVLPLVTLETILLRSATFMGTVSADTLLQKMLTLEERFLKSSPSSPVQNPEREKPEPVIKAVPSDTDKNEKKSVDPEVSHWEELVSIVKRKKPLLAANLEEGTAIELTDNSVHLIYESDSFSYKQVSDGENKKDLENILKNKLGDDFRVKASVGKAEEFSRKKKINLQQIKQEKHQEGINQLRDTAMNHPNVNNVKDLLGGEIVNVTIDEDNKT